MKTFRVFYWRETGNDCIDFEQDIMAYNFDEAFTKFREEKRLVKIRAIEQIF
jgi:hypothetical protein